MFAAEAVRLVVAIVQRALVRREFCYFAVGICDTCDAAVICGVISSLDARLFCRGCILVLDEVVALGCGDDILGAAGGVLCIYAVSLKDLSSLWEGSGRGGLYVCCRSRV